jgi:hypothetical protein
MDQVANYAQQYRQGVDQLYQQKIGNPTKQVDEDSFKELLYQCVLSRSKSVPNRQDKKQNFQQNRKMVNKWFDQLSSVEPEVGQMINGVLSEVTTNRQGSSSERDIVPKIIQTLMQVEQKGVNSDQLHNLMSQLQTDKLTSQNATERRNRWIAVGIAALGIIGNIVQGIIQATHGTIPTNTTA